ncbi:Mut7-C RNAse domain-containing protein [Halorubrum rutilum]|uniref:Mut7-C RNAse domain-containing protein n=1 Tax=Halorubrum rutilum TaxID=1364933 RepID=A0ABD6AKY5_9EURY|nr:Mut7-C RNAse domain-containing protein [Halorubrum rutilum]
MAPRVLCDAMCGKLATYLRMCGHDAAYALDRGVEADDRLLSIAAEEDRTLITRDRELAARAADRDPAAVLLTERDVLDQLREVAAAGLPVELAAEPTRCGDCNGPVERIGPGADIDPGDRPEYVPDDVGASPAAESPPDGDDPRPAWRCRDCGRWFWKGGHWTSVAERLDAV